MTQWYVNELSKITNISVRTLHHYDKIGLLKPSVRSSNGYRLYSEGDLLKLQQILALKYFGFELAAIKLILKGNINLFDYFHIQSQLLEEKANNLIKVNETLKRVMLNYSANQSIPWESVLNLMEVYRMTQQLEKSWAAKIFSPEELKKFSEIFSKEDLKCFLLLKSEWSEADQINFKIKWGNIMGRVLENLKEDPNSDLGIHIGKDWMALVNEMYGKEYVLRNTIWDAYKNGKIISNDVFPLDAMIWIDSAIAAYYYDRGLKIINDVSNKISKNAKPLEYKKLAEEWFSFKEESLGIEGKIIELEQNLKPDIKIRLELF